MRRRSPPTLPAGTGRAARRHDGGMTIDGNHPVLAVLGGLPPAERLVLLVLAARADEDGTAWPSVARLAADTGYDSESVRRAVKALVARGELMPAGKGPGARADRLPDRYAVRACLEPAEWARVGARHRLSVVDELEAQLAALDNDQGAGRITRREWSLARELLVSRLDEARAGAVVTARL